MLLKKKKWIVSGVEPSKKAREIANSKLQYSNNRKKNGVHLVENTSIYTDIFELKNTKFDVITMWHVLEHVPNLEEYISKLKQILALNGTLIVAVPNFKSYDANYYGAFWAAYDVPRHLSHFSKKAIKLLFEKENMTVVNTIPMKFDAYYVSLLSEKYKSGKSNLFKSFSIGLLSNIKAKASKEYSSHIYVIKNS